MSAPSYRQLLTENDDYRRLWLGQVISFFGDWFSTIAIYEIVQSMTDSATAIGGVLVVKMLPIFLVTPIVGPLVDRFDRRKLLLLTDFARSACVIGVMAAWRLDSLPLLFAILAIQIAFTGLFLPTRSAVVPQLTQRNELPVALALSGGTWSVMLAFGAAAGGLVTHSLGVDFALALDAATYLLSAAFLWKLPPLPPLPSQSKIRATFADGVRYLRHRPYLSTTLSMKSVMALTGGALVCLPFFGNGVFPATAGPLFVGLLYAGRGMGSLVGAMGLRRFTGDAPDTLRRWVAPGFGLMCVSYIGLAAAPNLATAALAYFCAATGGGIVWVFAGTLGQIASDGPFRGRIFAMEWGLMTLASSIATLSGGLLIDQAGWSYRQLCVLSGLAVVPFAIAWVVMLRRLKPEGDGRLSTPEGPTPAEGAA